MNVLIVADPVVPVPPVFYGGTERIVDLIGRGLVERGHRVHLMAGPGSRLAGGTLTVHRPPAAGYGSRAARKIWFQFLVLRAAMHADVAINFGRLDYLTAMHRMKVPLIHWFQNPLSGTEVPFVLRRRRDRVHFIAVSQSQVRGDPASDRFEVVHNAVDVATIPFSERPEQPPYLLFLGRLTRNKGAHQAIEVARRAGMRLVLGGNIPTGEDGGQDYFAAAVRPHLGPDCTWVGPYDGETRNRLLGGATALLFPIQWEEPFGIVMIESLAAGTPVIASRRASAPEVIAHGETGFLCDSADEMVAGVKRIGGLSRMRCRTSAENRFGSGRLVERTEDLLRRAVGS